MNVLTYKHKWEIYFVQVVHTEKLWKITSGKFSTPNIQIHLNKISLKYLKLPPPSHRAKSIRQESSMHSDRNYFRILLHV